jgi:aryl-alcohol dehydrogenase-like predicted oxidoreductase
MSLDIDLRPRQLGGSDMHVGRIVLGTMTFGEQVSEDVAIEIVRTAREGGVTLFDTANSYCEGRSEEILGRVVAPFRDEVQIATKVGSYRSGVPKGKPRLDRHSILRECKESLQRLRTDRIDLYYLHMPDPLTDIEETLGALDELVTAGHVRSVAMSNYAAWQMTDAIHLARERGWVAPIATQPMYNLIARRLEDELAPMTRHFGLSNLVYNPIAGGLLTGKHAKGSDPDPSTRFGMRRMYRDRYWNDSQFDAIEQLAGVAEQAGIGLIELAFRWLLMRDEVTGVILGVSSLEQLKDNLRAASGPVLDEATLLACDQVWDDLRGAAPAYSR